MSVLLAIAIWVGVSTVCAPFIGRLLFAMDASEPLIVPVRRLHLTPHYFARRQSPPASWSRRNLSLSKV